MRMASAISSRVRVQSSTRSAASSRSASAIARSSATQHMSFEYTKSRGSPRTSQIPWSCSCQRAAAVSARSARNWRVVGAEAVELVREAVRGVEQLAVDVELALVPRAVADAHRRAVAPPGEVRQLALGEVALAADAEHDLQVGAAPHQRRGRARHEVEELVRPRRGTRRPRAPGW